MSKCLSDGRDDLVKIYKFERYKRVVGNLGCCVEVIYGIEVDCGFVDRSVLKYLEVGYFDGFFESNGIVFRDVFDVNISFIKDGYFEGFVGE